MPVPDIAITLPTPGAANSGKKPVTDAPASTTNSVVTEVSTFKLAEPSTMRKRPNGAPLPSTVAPALNSTKALPKSAEPKPNQIPSQRKVPPLPVFAAAVVAVNVTLPSTISLAASPVSSGSSAKLPAINSQAAVTVKVLSPPIWSSPPSTLSSATVAVVALVTPPLMRTSCTGFVPVASSALGPQNSNA